MTALHRPDLLLRMSFLDTVADFGAETIHGSGIGRRTAEEELVRTPEGVVRFVADRLAYADPSLDLGPDKVHCDYYWLIDSETDPSVLGFLALRHRLNGFLLEQGGHIGYSVRPGARRHGHATRALGLALRRCVELGLERVLLTCDVTNVASARTIEANGGVLEDVRQGKRRYWIAAVD